MQTRGGERRRFGAREVAGERVLDEPRDVVWGRDRFRWQLSRSHADEPRPVPATTPDDPPMHLHEGTGRERLTR